VDATPITITATSPSEPPFKPLSAIFGSLTDVLIRFPF
jgi:hypothetical protein